MIDGTESMDKSAGLQTTRKQMELELFCETVATTASVNMGVCDDRKTNSTKKIDGKKEKPDSD